MSAALRKFFLTHPTNMVVVATMWSVVFCVFVGFAFPYGRNVTGLALKVLQLAELIHLLFLFFALIGVVVFLIRFKFVAALSYFASAFIISAFLYGSLAFRGDKFTFPDASHREIADIYNQNQSEFATATSAPRLFSVDRRCHPPNGCECWILVDPDRASGVEKEVGVWHRPTANIFPMNTLPMHFAIVDVKRIDSEAHSVLGCSSDLTAWNPL